MRNTFIVFGIGILFLSVAGLAFDVQAQQPVATSPTPNAAKPVVPARDDTNGKSEAKASPAPTADSQSNQDSQGKSGNSPTDNPARRENETEEDAAILPYYNNYLREYHLGPEDVISVEVFGQANYSKSGIIVPPTARISYPLIPGGVFVGGKTVDEVAEDIKKKLNEYIIDPQVTVTLEKVGSAHFSVLGKVGTPGVKVMSRRYNLFEAISEAGGISKEGDKKRVMLVRMDPKGGFSQQVIDFTKLLNGKAEMPYLVPGDQIIVPEKTWSISNILSTVSKASMLRILFGVPF